jgi:hypothetical protein
MLWSEEEEYWSNMFLSGQEHMTHSLIHPPTRQPNFAVGSLEYLFYNIIFREYHMTHSLTHPFWSKERKQGRKEGEREGELLASSLPTCPMPAFQAKQSLEGGQDRAEVMRERTGMGHHHQVNP